MKTLAGIVGLPGSGKTTTLEEMSNTISKGGKKILFISNNPVNVNDKITSILTDKDKDFNTVLTEEVMSKLEEIKENFDTLFFDVYVSEDDFSNETIDSLKALTREHNLSLVMSIVGKHETYVLDIEEPVIFSIFDIIVFNKPHKPLKLNFPDY